MGKIGSQGLPCYRKMSEIEMVLAEAESLNVTPRLGVRARLASQGSGKWQASGGENLNLVWLQLKYCN